MNILGRMFAACLVCIIFCVFPADKLHAGLVGAGGGHLFSKEFLQEYEAAQKSVDMLKSAEPLLALLGKYREPWEQAKLQLSIGQAYSQRSGVVDPAKAIVYLSRALEFEFPEETCIQICLWRGNCHEVLKKYPEAVRDYIRGLLACSYWDLEGGWPEVHSASVPIFASLDDLNSRTLFLDYRWYRNAVERKQNLLQQRYYLIQAVKRVQTDGAIADNAVEMAVKELTPDRSRYEIIAGLMKSENKQPWP